MVAFRAVLVLCLIAVTGIANAQQTPKPKRDGATAALSQPPAQELGYDYRGRLAPQPRLALNLFALSDDLPGYGRTEAQAFGRFTAETLRMVRDLATEGIIDYAAIIAAREEATGVSASAGAGAAVPDDMARRVEDLTQRLKQRRPPKMQHPDMARALAVMARDAGRLATAMERTRAGTQAMLKAATKREAASVREAVLDQFDGLDRTLRVAIASTQSQLGAAVGGTPDLWLWRADIEAGQLVQTMLRDMRYVIAEEKLPSAIGRLNIEENLVAMAEWVRRGEMQVRHELSRLQTGREPSPTRAMWLEKVFLNYQSAIQVARGIQAWLAADVPAVYAKLARDCIGACNQMRSNNMPRFRELTDEQTRLAIERYNLLAQMP